MTKTSMLAGALVCLSAMQALMQPAMAADDYRTAVTNGDITSNGADQGPGGLSARDVVGKHLNDSEGNWVGMIERVSPDGRTAFVRAPGGARLTFAMDRLSLGMGAHTVIDQGSSRADQLNAAQAALPLAQTGSSGSSSTVTTQYTAPPTVTTTTTSVTTERTR